MKQYANFGQERFAKMFGCDTYDFPGSRKFDLDRLLDHGFIADRDCCWDKQMEGHEYAIVARTYCTDEEIDNPPEGLRCHRLDRSVMGQDDLGTAIAVVIVGKSAAAESILSACCKLRCDILAHMIPLAMIQDGYSMLISAFADGIDPSVSLVKSENYPMMCHFCGSHSKQLVPAHNSSFHEKKGVQAECINCGARGPIYGDEESAFKAWRYGEPDHQRADFKK